MADVDDLDWEHLAKQLGATYEAGPFHVPHRLQAPVGAVLVHLDIFVDVGTFAGIAVLPRRLRVRMPFVSTDDFRLHVRPMGTVARMLRLEDVKTGDAAFDEVFRVTTNRPERITELLSDAAGYRKAVSFGGTLRRRFVDNPWLEICVDDPGVWSDGRQFFPGTLEAELVSSDLTLATPTKLVTLVETFRELFDALVAIGSAEDRNPIDSRSPPTR